MTYTPTQNDLSEPGHDILLGGDINQNVTTHHHFIIHARPTYPCASRSNLNSYLSIPVRLYLGAKSSAVYTRLHQATPSDRAIIWSAEMDL